MFQLTFSKEEQLSLRQILGLISQKGYLVIQIL